MKRILYFFVLFSLQCFAGNPPPPGLEDPTPAGAPIDQIDIFLFITAIILGVYYTFCNSKKWSPANNINRILSIV